MAKASAKKHADKSVRQGGTLLVPRDKWCPLSEIQGRDPDVLASPTMELAYRAVLDRHCPKHEIAVCSLCTTTRPYSSGRKWATLQRTFGHACDLIVTSNGGVIPLLFEKQFPYLNYDAHGEPQFDAAYIAKLGSRMEEFFLRHRYRQILFLYRPNLRNARLSQALGPKLKAAGAIEDFAILPTVAQYEQSQRERFHLKGFKMFPELYPTMLNPAVATVRNWVTHNKTAGK